MKHFIGKWQEHKESTGYIPGNWGQLQITNFPKTYHWEPKNLNFDATQVYRNRKQKGSLMLKTI